MKLKIREQTNRKIELSDWEIINKVYRRLYTCSYKIKMNSVVMKGVYDEKESYFDLTENNENIIADQINYNIGNCEDRDFYKKFIAYISCIKVKEIARRFPFRHIFIRGKIKGYKTQVEFIKEYIRIATKSEILWGKDKYEELLNLQDPDKVDISKYSHYLKKFLNYNRKQFIYGITMKGMYIKFSYSEQHKEEFRRYGDGKFYLYQENEVAKDCDAGSGFSFGKIEKAFLYFEGGNYGEQFMIVKPLMFEKYYEQEYEYLGKRIKIKKICSFKDIETIKFILEKMTKKGKEAFFKNKKSDSIAHSYGTVENVIFRMEAYQKKYKNNDYAGVIDYLKKETKNGQTIESLNDKI